MRLSPCPSVLGLCSLALFGVFAQRASAASLVVTVRSADSESLLRQARVELAPAGRAEMTDELGAATFADVLPGDYTARVSYLGFTDYSESVHVTSAARQNISIQLKTGEVVRLNKFVVTTEREGNAASLTLQKNADSVKNVIAMDALGVLANDNPAELLNRLPGVYSLPSDEGNLDRPTIRGMPATMNRTTVDGVTLVSQLAMSRTPIYTNMTASNFEEIEVTKALTPNMPADSISGLVNFKTKSTLNMRAKREISFRAGGKWSPTFFDYTPRRTSPQVQPQFQLGYREIFKIFGSDTSNLGLNGNFVYNENVTQRTISIPTIDTAGARPLFTTGYSAQDGIQDRRLTTASLRTDFRYSESSRFYFNYMNNFQEQATSRPQNYQENYTASINATAGRAFATGVNADGTPTGGGNVRPGSTVGITEVLRSTRTQLQISTLPFEADDTTNLLGFGGEHRFGPWRIDYTINNTRGERDTGAYRNHAVRRNWTATITNIGWILDATKGEDFPVFRQTTGPSIYDPRNYTNGTFSQTSAVSVNRSTSAEFNVKRDLNITGRKVLLRFGGLASRQSSDQDSVAPTHTYLGPDGVRGVNPATGINDDDLTRFVSYPEISPRFGLGAIPAFDPWKYGGSYDKEPNQWLVDPYQVESSRRSSYRDVEEKLLAGYGMGSTTFGRLGLVTGVRWEQTRTLARAFIKSATLANIANPAARTDAEYGTTPNSRRGGSEDYFPSAHLRYAIQPNLIARASYSTSVGRPALSDLVPVFSANDANQTVSIDNPSLKSQHADSYDLTLEYYLKPVGLISAGWFRKNLSDFTFRQEVGFVAPGANNGYDGQYVGYTIVSTTTGGKGQVDGLEFSYLQQLTFLPKAFGGLTVLINYTHLRAAGDYGQSSGGTTGLAGFVPHTANARLSYKYGWFAPYAQWSYVGRNLNSFGTAPQLATDRLERRIVNAGFSLKLPRNLEFYFDISNLFDESQRFVQSNNGVRNRTIVNGPFVSFGVNGRF